MAGESRVSSGGAWVRFADAPLTMLEPLRGGDHSAVPASRGTPEKTRDSHILRGRGEPRPQDVALHADQVAHPRLGESCEGVGEGWEQWGDLVWGRGAFGDLRWR